MKEHLAEVIELVQRSHVALAEGKHPEARVIAMKAATKAGKVLNAFTDPAELRLAKPVAAFTLQWTDLLRKDADKALALSDKLLWLSCEIHGANWFPVFKFEKGLSMDYQPVNYEDIPIQLPDTGLEQVPEFRLVDSDPGLEGFDDLCQDLLPNCSFVLSLLSIYDLNLGDKLEKLVRYDDEEEAVKVKLHINGCEREINISADLPFLDYPHNERHLFVLSTTNVALMWPAYLEKAYLIALGDHYNFLGSNMAQDTYMLLGWAPEVRKISKMSMESFAELWDLRKKGLLALGLGTGQMLDSLASQLKVVSGHDYVVSGYSEKGLTLKNPWSSGQEGRFLNVDASVFGQFSYVYLNWNMDALYKHSFSTAVISPPPKSKALLLDRPQFVLENSSNETQTVGITVEHFVLKNEPVSPYSVSVYENTRGKVVYPSQYVRAAGGKMTTMRVYFLKFEIAANSKNTLVIAGPQGRVIFLLKLWSHSPDVKMYRAKPTYDNVTEIEDAWTKDNNGGNWALELYIDNPQWELEIKRRMPKLFIAVSCKEESDVNFHLLHTEKSQNLTKLRNFDKSKILFCDNYSPGIHHHELHDVEPGNLRLVVSNYNSDYIGKFHLLLMYDGSKGDLIIEKVPKALGLYNDTVEFSWNLRNRYKFTVRTEVTNTSVIFKLQAGTKLQTLSLYRPAVRASLFDAVTQQPVVVNDKWNDSVYGVFVDCVLKKPNHDYILLVERFETGEGICRVTLGSSSRLSVKGEDEK